MPAPSPDLAAAAAAALQALGEQLRLRRKSLGISAVAAAEAAGLSRVTLHRIERGEPSVTMGSYLNTALALGLQLSLGTPAAAPDRQEAEGWIPARVRLDQYPQLRRLAWQVHGVESLSPAEALDIYERNARHLDAGQMEPAERALLDNLRVALARNERNV